MNSILKDNSSTNCPEISNATLVIVKCSLKVEVVKQALILGISKTLISYVGLKNLKRQTNNKSSSRRTEKKWS